MKSTKNRIREILQEKGIEELKPTLQQLNKMNTTLTMWNKWIENKRNPEFDQLILVADFLDCTVQDIFPSKEKVTQ